MTGSEDSRQNGTMENFEEMLEAYTGADKALSVGDKVSGPIIGMSGDNLFVDVGAKIDGLADRTEFLSDEGELTVAEGDTVELFVTAVKPDAIHLSKAVSGPAGAAMLEEAFNTKLPVEGKVLATRKGGFDVEVSKRRVFCPVSQIDTRFVENAEEYVGKTFSFAIIKFEQRGRNIVVSRRVLLEQEQQAARDEFLKNVKEGDLVDVTITRLTNFGAFAELADGVEGLIHVSELSWTRIAQADEAVSVGDKLRVKLLGIETDKKGQLRISLSAKQVQENPWNRVETELTAGEVREGKVVRLTPFGAFVEVLPGIDGLVHISEMSYTKRVHKAEDVVSVGDTVSVKIKSIDLTARRISLSMRDAEGDPWVDVEERFPTGTTVEGTVESSSDFGLFINIAPGVTGLMPKSMMAKADKAANLDTLKSGDKVEVTVAQLRTAERKVTLAPKGVSASEDTSWKAHRKTQTAKSEPQSNFGSLGSLLQDALNKKK